MTRGPVVSGFDALGNPEYECPLCGDKLVLGYCVNKECDWEK